MTVRYPIAGLTKHGAYHLIKGSVPMVWLESHDGTVIFDLMGGRSIPDRRAPESVQLAKDGLKGLIPPWRSIDQKGASQDGVTFVDSLYDPAEVAITVFANGRDREHLRAVVRDLIASLDTKKVAKLHFWSHQLGHWWADLRWFKTPPDANQIAARRRHRMTLITRSDDAFWRSDADVDLWSPSYEAMAEKFNFTQEDWPNATSLGANWPLLYYGAGQGYLEVDGSKVVWVDENGWSTGDRGVVVGPYKDFSTLDDYQVVTMTTGHSPQWSARNQCSNDLWGRMGRNVNGTWNGYGIRFRVGMSGYELARFNGFRTGTSSGSGSIDQGWYPVYGLTPADWPTDDLIQCSAGTGTANGRWFKIRHRFGNVEIYNDTGQTMTWFSGDTWRQVKRTVMAKKSLILPLKLGGEKWTLLCGVEGDKRQFVVMRNDVEVFWHKESGTGSALGSAYRGIGFGMAAAGSLVRQATPSTVKSLVSADNITVSQEGYLNRLNIGDQPMYDEYTVFGPGTFKFWLGPNAGANDYVEFGPLLPSQVVQINTDPRKRSVQDLTSTPASPQELTQWQAAIDKFLSFGGTGSLPLVQQIKSKWGILPPQGPLYSLLKGRWSDTSAIPPKPAGGSAQPYKVKVAVDNGGPSSKIIASGIPKRRYPL